MRPYDLLVFDWDGTLIDSIRAIVDCTHETMAELELPPVPDTTIREAIGLGLRETVERFHPGCDEATFRRILEVYRRRWLATHRHRLEPFAEVDRLLQDLAAAGYLLAVATAKGRHGLTQDFERTGLGAHFVASRTVDEAPSKPSPGMLQSLLHELGVRPERALMIGDTGHDLQMAANAGVAAVAVLTGSQGEDLLAPLEPLALLGHVGELPGWLAACG